MKDAFTRKKKNEEFRLERFTFLRKAQAVEESKKKREILAATKIQALYRGYHSRPNIHRNKRRKRINKMSYFFHYLSSFSSKESKMNSILFDILRNISFQNSIFLLGVVELPVITNSVSNILSVVGGRAAGLWLRR